jgi:hypothetical protein
MDYNTISYFAYDYALIGAYLSWAITRMDLRGANTVGLGIHTLVK